MQNSFKKKLDEISISIIDLSFARALFYILIFINFFNNDFEAYAKIPIAFFEPTPIFSFLRLPAPADFLYFKSFHVLWKLSLILSALGFLSPLSKIFAFVGSFYLLGLDSSFGFDHHRYGVLVIHLGILCLFNTEQYFSIDRLIIKNFGKYKNTKLKSLNPTILFKLALALVYFSAGYTKLKSMQMEFFSKESIQEFMYIGKAIYSPFQQHGLLLEGIRSFIIERAYMVQVIGISALMFELLSVVMIFNKKLTAIFVIGLFAMHFSIYVMMYIKFYETLMCLVFWIPWSKIPITRKAVG